MDHSFCVLVKVVARSNTIPQIMLHFVYRNMCLGPNPTGIQNKVICRLKIIHNRIHSRSTHIMARALVSGPSPYRLELLNGIALHQKMESSFFCFATNCGAETANSVPTACQKWDTNDGICSNDDQ